jgi:SAM-dependent methyltransferase
MNEKVISIKSYKFEKNDFLHYFKNLLNDRGPKAFYQFLNRPQRRQYSRSLIKKNSPKGYGLEIGCGARTICPTDRTVLSDGHSDHGIHGSIAKIFFKGDKIPYENNTFDFVISEHVLEHITDPIKALNEWLRVLKSGGHIYCFLPHKERTNDKYRDVTTLDHLITDFERSTPYDDEEHFEDWRSNVVDKGLMPDHYKHMDRDELLASASIHHHVWTEKEIVELFEYLNLEIVHVDQHVHDRRDSFVVIGKKK